MDAERSGCREVGAGLLRERRGNERGIGRRRSGGGVRRSREKEREAEGYFRHICKFFFFKCGYV